ncbi:PLP-dependent transferase [Alicyclobacillaceae bacterium I2511]|nr:PLP-dependent transferase [Alicyclobacillaceae bacterium I2511]
MNTGQKALDTRLVHPPDSQGEGRLLGAVSPPIFQTSTFVFDSAEQGGARFAGTEPGYVYSRIANPTVRLLEQAVADAEGAQAGLAFGSGMAAISSVLVQLLRSGDHVLVSRGVYGGTFALLELLAEKFGIHHTFAKLTDESAVRQAWGEQTRLVYVETPVNPTMELVDIAACARVAHEHGALLVVDNTFATPVLQRPLELGADVVIHSATKYLGGHGDVILGLAAGTDELMSQIRLDALKDFGGITSPFDAWLVLRGMKTLAVRVRRHTESAQEIATRLQEHPQVVEVYYPGLPDFPQQSLYRQQMHGGGGMVSFIIRGGDEAGVKFMDRLELCERAVSLGEAHTLVEHPASMTHAGIPAEVRREMGIRDGLVRISVGLEDVEDIWADLEQSFKSIT